MVSTVAYVDRRINMRKKIKKSLVIMMVTAMTATLCVSCGGGKSKKKSETTKTESSAPKAGDIAEGGKVTVGVTQDLDSLDPHNCVYAGTREVLFNIFEGLVKPTSEGELVPAVASEYNISEDGTVYSFKLRDGIKFHDGNAVSVDDVKYSIDRYAEIKKEEEHERELSSERELARKDELTGVKNKNAYREFEENLQKKMNSKAKILPFAVVVCDINDLKKINDTLGHVAGDEHIKKACKMICEVFAHSPVYRVGGDEFVAVLSGDDFVNREKLLKKLRGKVLKNVNKPNGVVVASGISDYESMKDKSLSDVFERADARMYENKNFLKYI